MLEHATQAEHLTPSLTSMGVGGSGEDTVTRVCLSSFLTSKGQWKTLSDLTGSSSEPHSESRCGAAPPADRLLA